MKIISIIPARGGSKGIRLKNLKVLCGKPLLDYSINTSLKSKFIKRTFVSSDHIKILNHAQKLGAEIITRPKNISTDKSTTESYSFAASPSFLIGKMFYGVSLSLISD